MTGSGHQQHAGVRYAIGVGSNLGDRRRHLADGIAALGGAVGILRCSSWLENPAEGGPPGQGDYLNGVWLVGSDLSPLELLHRLLAVEAGCGRVRVIPGAARTLDLDLLLSEPPLIIEHPVLRLPHPRLHRRRFVMLPLREVAPDWFHPVLGCTVEEIGPPTWR